MSVFSGAILSLAKTKEAIVIPYFGTPISGAETVAIRALRGAHGFVSFAERGQFRLCVELCQSFAVDNGAYSFWKSGKKTDWGEYYLWVEEIKNLQNFDWAIIPDVIGGTEDDNDRLIEDWPHHGIGVPVWHMSESIGRLGRLSAEFPRVAIGSSGEYRSVGGRTWWERINLAMADICDKDGIPKTKIHGLRMLAPKIVSNLPMASADSTSVSRNVGIDKAWGRYSPATKEGRAMVLRERTEAIVPAKRWTPVATQELLF